MAKPYLIVDSTSDFHLYVSLSFFLHGLGELLIAMNMGFFCLFEIWGLLGLWVFAGFGGWGFVCLFRWFWHKEKVGIRREFCFQE